MRLIDADALKKALKSNCDTLCNDRNTNWCEHCCPHNDFEDLIDNAPTVNDCPNCEYKKNYDYLSSSSSYKELQALREFKKENERPQGEWQYTTHHARRYRICPFCKCEKEDDRSAGWFYCWHCGARMKGGTE